MRSIFGDLVSIESLSEAGLKFGVVKGKGVSFVKYTAEELLHSGVNFLSLKENLARVGLLLPENKSNIVNLSDNSLRDILPRLHNCVELAVKLQTSIKAMSLCHLLWAYDIVAEEYTQLGSYTFLYTTKSKSPFFNNKFLINNDGESILIDKCLGLVNVSYVEKPNGRFYIEQSDSKGSYSKNHFIKKDGVLFLTRTELARR